MREHAVQRTPSAGIRARRADASSEAIPLDLFVLILAVAAFVAFGLLLSLALGVPFVMPRGESPALRMSAKAPLVVTLVAYLGAQAAVCFKSRQSPLEASWRRHASVDLLLLLLFALVLYVHFHIKMWVPLVNAARFDSFFLAVDQQLWFLIDGLRALRAGVALFMPSPNHWYQGLLFGSFASAFACHAISRREWHIQHMIAITLVEVIGPLLYLAFPAIGPFAFEPGSNLHATESQQRMLDLYMAMWEGGAGWVSVHGPEYLTAPLAAMPSLHVAATVVIAYYAVRARLVIAPIVVFAAGWIAVEAVVTRWHYLLDLPVGAGVAAVSIMLANRLCRFRKSHSVADEAAESEKGAVLRVRDAIRGRA